MREVMREVHELLHPDHDLLEARRRMTEAAAAMLPVVDGDEIVGVLTSPTVARRLAGEGGEASQADSAAEAHVRDDMITSIPVCRPDETLGAVAAVIEQRSLPGLLVINKADELIGIVSRADLAQEGFVFARGGDTDAAPDTSAHAVKSAARARGDEPGRLTSYSVKPRIRR